MASRLVLADNNTAIVASDKEAVVFIWLGHLPAWSPWLILTKGLRLDDIEMKIFLL